LTEINSIKQESQPLLRTFGKTAYGMPLAIKPSYSERGRDE
jgi:hypothetical protein